MRYNTFNRGSYKQLGRFFLYLLHNLQKSKAKMSIFFTRAIIISAICIFAANANVSLTHITGLIPEALYTRGLLIFSNFFLIMLTENSWPIKNYLTYPQPRMFKKSPHWVILRVSRHSVQMRENADQKTSEYGHFSRSARLVMKIFSIKNLAALNESVYQR